MINENSTRIAIIGMGYVGLPLAVEFGKIFETIGFDFNKSRIKELLAGKDSTFEVEYHNFQEATKLSYTTNTKDIQSCNIFIVTVPTPVDEHKKPDLTLLVNASETAGKLLKKDDIVIYESTVFPGATEEICVPILEQQSGLKFNQDFFCGYSPERINPGDKERRVTSIKKITSGSTPKIAEKVDALYRTIITAGTYKTSSIKVAEAAKVIENTQRDVNIALINELSIIFRKLNINTEEVLVAAESKWNFLKFRPGLVGGHCLGVDPYYLTHKSIGVGYHPEMILAGRRINDDMGIYVAGQVIKLMTKNGIHIFDSNVLIMGLAFKENCPDIRNTRVVDLIGEFNNFNCNIDVYDPWVDKVEAYQEYGITLIEKPGKRCYDAIILAVSHNQFKDLGAKQLRQYGKKNHVLYDVKYILNFSEVDGRL